MTSFANELGRWSNVVRTRITTGTNTIRFIYKDVVPHNKRAIYDRKVSSIKSQKEERYRTKLTVRVNLLNYDSDTSSPTTDLNTTNVHINSVVSIPNAHFMIVDISIVYLDNILPEI